MGSFKNNDFIKVVTIVEVAAFHKIPGKAGPQCQKTLDGVFPSRFEFHDLQDIAIEDIFFIDTTTLFIDIEKLLSIFISPDILFYHPDIEAKIVFSRIFIAVRP